MGSFKPDLPGILVSKEQLQDICAKCGEKLFLYVYVEISGKIERIGACEKCHIIYGTINQMD